MNKLMMAAGMAAGGYPKTPIAASNYNRALYNWIANDPSSPYKNNVIEESVLRSPVILTDGQNQIRFPVKETDQRDPLSVGLKQNDVFYISQWNIHLRQRIYTDAQKNAIKSNSIPYTWANTFVFGALGGDESLRNLFTVGLFNMIVGSTKFHENYPVEKFMKVPTAQKGLFNADTLNNGQYFEDAFNDNEIFMEAVPSMALAGSDSIECTLDLNGLDQSGLQFASDIAENNNILELEFRGFLIKDGAHLVKVTK